MVTITKNKQFSPKKNLEWYTNYKGELESVYRQDVISLSMWFLHGFLS